jgi:hypothetical protein
MLKRKVEEPKWNPYMKFVWTTAQMQAWVDFNGRRGLWDGQAWEMKYKKLCPNRYEISFTQDGGAK